MTHLDQTFRSLKEVLFALRLGTLLMPINNGLIRDAVRVVKDLDDAEEGFHDPSVRVAIDLNRIDEGDFRLGAIAVCFENSRIGLISVRAEHEVGNSQ